jgi:hypothetical protein
MGGGKGNGGMGGGGDVRQVPGPWRMPTSWGGSPSSGLPGSFPAGPRMSAGGGFAGMGGYPGNSPWGGGPPMGSAMQPPMQTGTGMMPPPMSHGDPIPTNQVATTDMGMPGGEARGGLHYAMPMATGGPTPWGGGGMNYARPMPWRGGMF